MRNSPRWLMALAAAALTTVWGCPTNYVTDDDSADDDDSAATDDADGDGYTSDEDCDDNDATLNLDDADADGFTSCGGDCDDTDPFTNPAAIERCDGLDNDCSGFAELDGDGVCGIWSIGATETSWTARAMNPSGSPHGPSATIQAGFAMTDIHQIYVVTATSYHVMEISSMQWSSSGARDDLFPELSGITLRAAVGQPASFTGGDTATVHFAGDDAVYGYDYSVSGGTFTFTGATDYGEDWDGPLAPSPSTIIAGWLDMDNAAGWMNEGNPQQSCGAESPTIGTYFAFLTSAGRIHFYDGQYCAEFFTFTDTESWFVFSLETAPLGTMAKATAWTGNRLFFFGPP